VQRQPIGRIGVAQGGALGTQMGLECGKVALQIFAFLAQVGDDRLQRFV
jgi:hypothetical protein